MLYQVIFWTLPTLWIRSSTIWNKFKIPDAHKCLDYGDPFNTYFLLFYFLLFAQSALDTLLLKKVLSRFRINNILC